MWKRKKLLLLMLLILSLALTGCNKVKISTGLGKDVFMTIQNTKIPMSQAKLLLSEMKYSYEQLFDANVWSEKMGDTTTEEYVKNSVSDTVRYLAYLSLMAEEMQVELDSGQLETAKEAAKAYMETLPSDNSVTTEAVVEKFYRDLCLGEKVFYIVTDDVDTEVSTDEARIIDVQYMFFSTEDLTEAEKTKKQKLAGTALEEIEEGSDFVSIAREYSDDDTYTLELGRGEYQESFEDAAFDLEMGEVSDVVETDEGYYIIKCTNENVDSDYDKRSEEIVLARRTKMFSAYFAEFTDDMDSEINNYYWSDMPMSGIEAGSGELYDIYSEYFNED